MTLRTYLYRRLTEVDTDLFALIAGRAYPKKNMRSSVEPHPYLVFKLGNDTAEGLSETVDPHRQYFTIYIHDDNPKDIGGDYMRIDAICRVLKAMLKNASSPVDDVMQILYLETSQDLDDQTLGTVMRYMRFQAIVHERTLT